jgi:hypothetical protein
LAGTDWETYFNSFEREAFRLETLPVYGVTSEDEMLAKFLATGELDVDEDDDYYVRVRGYRRSGRWIGRVHVISRPLTDYLRFELAAYRYNVSAGEDVRILDVTDQPNPGLPNQDFWMFDETNVVRMDYEPDGTQIGRELLEGIDPAPYVAWKHLAMEHAVPYLAYMESKIDG